MTMSDMPSSSSSNQQPVADRCLSVRFEDSCVLIPPAGPPKSPLRPRIITKSYSLPLWKTSSSKKNVTFRSLVSELNGDAGPEARKAFSLTVSVPSLTTRSRPHRPSLTPPSPSCLSKRAPSLTSSYSPSPSPTSAKSPSGASPPRPPSFPQTQPAVPLKQADTIPLRPCCEACHPCVDAALAQGERWSTQWSKGAVRRYSEGEHVHLHAPHPSEFGVTRVWTPKNVGADPDGGDVPLEDALTIDEVDVKRRSFDYAHASLNNHHVPPSATADAESDDDEVSRESTDMSPLDPPFRAAVLPEEDEDMLFPLPSPRRTPNHSPVPTPTGSQVNLSTLHSGNAGPLGSQTTLALASPDGNPPVPVPHPSPAPARPPPPVPFSQAEPAPDLLAPRSLPSSPVYGRPRATSSSPDARRVPLDRRSSFSTMSETLIRSSASMLKGVAAGMKSGAGGFVGVMH